MTFSVVFTPEAEEQLLSLYRYIAGAGSPERGAQYADSIIAFCEELAAFPHRGRERDDIRPGLRTIGFRRRAIVAFAVAEPVVVIVGVFYGGQDYESHLTDIASEPWILEPVLGRPCL